jgi:hypothetical protein
MDVLVQQSKLLGTRPVVFNVANLTTAPLATVSPSFFAQLAKRLCNPERPVAKIVQDGEPISLEIR